MHKEIRKALEEATPGPWQADMHPFAAEILSVKEDNWGWICQLWYKDEEPMPNFKANARLIANAPTWLKQLLDENEQLRRERDGARKQLKASRDSVYGISVESDEAKLEAREEKEKLQTAMKALKEIRNLVSEADEEDFKTYVKRETLDIASEAIKQIEGGKEG